MSSDSKDARQLTRAVVLNAAMQAVAIECSAGGRFMTRPQLRQVVELWVNQLEYYVERGRWPDDSPR